MLIADSLHELRYRLSFPRRLREGRSPGSFTARLNLWASAGRRAYFRKYEEGEPFFRELPDAALRSTAFGGVAGYCLCCDAPASFALPSQQHGSHLVNWREELLCTRCGLNSRMRFALCAMLAVGALDENARLYVTEQTTPTYAYLHRRFPATMGSEYYEGTGEHLQNYIRHLTRDDTQILRREDVTALTLADASVDCVLSFDVLEHVPDYPRALAEFARVLVRRGRLFLSVPFIATADATLVRARVLPDGSTEHLLPPEYHGDPTNDAGCLCYYHFGWDLLETMRKVGFRDAYALSGWSGHFGHVMPEILFVGRR